MIDFLQSFLQASWSLLESMAPWLLVGFLLAGVLGRFLPTELIRNQLARPSWSSVFKAVILGIPLPLCSCGVIPVAASLRKAGAGKGAVAAFTASTPQTGVDSISATYSLMGLPFTLGRICADVLSGLCAGLAINLFTRKESAAEAGQAFEEPGGCCNSGGCCEEGPNAAAPAAVEKCRGSTDDDPCHEPDVITGCGPGTDECAEKEDADCCQAPKADGEAEDGKPRRHWLQDIWRAGFVDLPRDIGLYLVIGILLGAILTVAIPANLLTDLLGGHLLATYALVTVLSIPVYVCATGSIPVAFGLMSAGISPGAAIIFLVTGPATNTATVTTLLKLIGKMPTVIYVVSLIAGAWAVGASFDFFQLAPSLGATGEMEEHGVIGTLSAIALLAILLNALRRRG